MVIGGVVIAADTPANTPLVTNTKTQQVPMTSQVSKIMASAVFSSDGLRVGDIKDIVFDPTCKQAGYAIVSCDRIGGMVGRYTAIPFRGLQYTGGVDVRLTINLKAVQNAPTFAAGFWPSEITTEHYTKADEYYGQQLKTAAIDTDKTDAQPAAAVIKGDITWTERATTLIGRNVQTPKGDSLGDLKDIVVDSKTGEVRYGVLSFGGMMGVGDKYFAVPMDQFKMQPGSDKFTLDCDKEQLKKASGFDKDRWPDKANPNWNQ